MSKVALKPSTAVDLYEMDFYAWTRAQAMSLSVRHDAGLDVVHLIDEVESLGRAQRAAVESHLRVLIAHLLKFRVQPERATPSWRITLRTQRLDIERRLARSPSLRGYPAEILAETYDDAVRLASRETNIDRGRFPQDCPFTLEQILDLEFHPI